MKKKKHCGYWGLIGAVHGSYVYMGCVIGLAKNVTLRREENGYKRMCLGRLCIYFLYW